MRCRWPNAVRIVVYPVPFPLTAKTKFNEHLWTIARMNYGENSILEALPMHHSQPLLMRFVPSVFMAMF
jgi:hypothetical protein